MTPSRTLVHLDALSAEQEEFARLAADADLDRPVPDCAPWTVGDLVRHLTAIHRWAAACTALDAHAALPDDAPFEAAAAVADYPAAAAELRAALGEAARPCPTLVGPGTAAWWARRQLHETFVHRLDLAAALGVAAEVDPAVAADCIAEVVDTMQPRQVRLGRMPPPVAGVRLTSPSGSWVLGGRPVAEVAGPERALAQLVWRRTTPADPRLSVTGDRAAATALLADRLTP
ncbi:maleylpyruvate isomerase family mycothiol-dependent enzyme [Modestobacter marinus]|uniref:maleylpyruvate isomerase family mycothiol-dependent enzyme n=1 Tax=Modestobacter marinus TaxID=477641 RepID=UPI001C96E1A7|nr:maleylpyruvate isomerase family mycothiol-dependent enzyme [Modestobacter marinus]